MPKKLARIFVLLSAVVCIFILYLHAAAPEESSPAEQGLEAVFKTDALQFENAPAFEKDCTVIERFSNETMAYTIYQLPDDSNYYLYITLAGVDYDMGLVGYLGTTIETFADTMIQESQITAPYPIYILNRNDSFDILTATYFTIQENIPVLLYTIPGKGAEEYDVDQDGQMETITNGGLSTSLDYWLYEWDIASGKVRIADFREQLSCDVVAFDAMLDVFIAGWREDNGWREISYRYRNGRLEEILSDFREFAPVKSNAAAENDPKESPAPVAAEGVCVSVRADTPVMYINGNPVSLSQSPYMEGNILFVPYEAVSAAFGGTFDYDAGTGTVSSRFPQIGTMQHSCTVRFSLNSREISMEELREVPPPLGTDFAGGDLTIYQARLTNGVVYVPIDYFFRFQTADWWQMAGSDRATLHNLKERFGAGPFVLEENFRDLDNSVTKNFSRSGEILYNYGGEIREIYTDGHVDLLLSTFPDGASDAAIIKNITLKDDFYATDRGLRVGDSEERFLDLYAGNNFSSVLETAISDGLVSRISFVSFF